MRTHAEPITSAASHDAESLVLDVRVGGSAENVSAFPEWRPRPPGQMPLGSEAILSNGCSLNRKRKSGRAFTIVELPAVLVDAPIDLALRSSLLAQLPLNATVATTVPPPGTES